MKVTNLKRVIKLGLLNFWRNKWLSLGSVLILSLTLITISVSVIQNYDISRTTEAIRGKLNITVYFNDKTTEQEIQDLQLKLQQRPDVKSVKYISKDEALKIWRERPSSTKVKDLVTPDSNPLPRSLEIKTYESESLESIAQLLKSATYTDKIRRVSYEDNKQFIQELISRNKIIVKNGLVSSLTFIIISLIVIINTIRIIVLSRKDEIKIIKLVGASDLFVKTPFFIEAIISALLSGLISSLFLYISFTTNIQIIPLFISQYFSGIEVSIEEIMRSYIWLIFISQFAFALFLIFTTTLFSIRKYLKN